MNALRDARVMIAGITSVRYEAAQGKVTLCVSRPWFVQAGAGEGGRPAPCRWRAVFLIVHRWRPRTWTPFPAPALNSQGAGPAVLTPQGCCEVRPGKGARMIL